jgi:hypothetical protein
MQKKYIILLSILGFALIGGGVVVQKQDAIRARFFSDQPANLPVAIDGTELVSNTDVQLPDGSEVPANLSATVPLPKQFNLAVPFVRQAPTNNWDATHEETCEEAAALTVIYYWQKVKNPTAVQMEAQYTKMIKYENKSFGDFKDTTAVQTAKMIKDVYGYKRVDVLPMTSLDDAKRHVLAGRPVIIPSAGKLLKNPNFKNGGPLYHNLVIRGWLADGRIITNDPGTRKGEGYVYKANILWNAIHDWNGGKVTAGKKVMIVVYPNSKK